MSADDPLNLSAKMDQLDNPAYIDGQGNYHFVSDTCRQYGIPNLDPVVNPWCPEFNPNTLFGNPTQSIQVPGYVYQLPFYQAKGINPETGSEELWQLDSYGVPYSKYNKVSDKWDLLSDLWPISIPRQGQWKAPLSPAESAQAISEIAPSLSSFTQYITWGDEPKIKDYVIDFKKQLSSDQYAQLFAFFQLTPREYLRAWFDDTIVPTLPGTAYNKAKDFYLTKTSPHKDSDDFVWAGMINVFNAANLDYCNTHQIDPWEWEKQKSRLFLLNQNKSQVADLQANFDAYRLKIFSSSPRAQDLMNRYSQLPKLGDLGLEVSRQTIFKELLERSEFDMAEGIIMAYTQAQATILDEGLRKPVPVNVVLADGRQVYATPPGQETAL